MIGLRLVRDARATGVTVAAIDHLLSVGYSLERARFAVSPNALKKRARIAALHALIGRVQGRARVRLLDGEDAYQIAVIAADEGAAFGNGGVPGKAYKDRWETTHVSAVLDVEQGVVHVVAARDGRYTAPLGLNGHFDRGSAETRERMIGLALLEARRVVYAMRIPIVELVPDV